MQKESLSIYEITDKKLWDNFVTSQPHHTFLHSWAWGEFNKTMGDRVWRFGVYAGDELVAVALVIKVHAKRGNFLFVPHGPIGDRQVFPFFAEKLKELAKQERVCFIRISPVLYDTKENKNLFKKLGFRTAPIHMHAETTWTLDLTPSEDQILMGMRKTTRNLIKRATREGVEIKSGASDSDIKVFNTLYQETVKKHKFTPFSLTYLKNQVKVLAENGSAQVFTAWHQNKPLAASIIVFYGNSAFYHHGASRQSKIPAAYLLQWEAILRAKRRGHKFYNFWGIVNDDAPLNHPWQGITLFKKGFGGFATDYLRAQDLPVNWRYWINWVVETMRKKRRNL